MKRLLDETAAGDPVRDLLEAGVADDVADYDFERGLTAHLVAVTAVGAGAAAATTGTAGVASTGTPAAAAGLGAASGLSGKALLAGILLPAASVGIVAALWFAREAPPSAERGAAPAAQVAAGSGRTDEPGGAEAAPAIAFDSLPHAEAARPASEPGNGADRTRAAVNGAVAGAPQPSRTPKTKADRAPEIARDMDRPSEPRASAPAGRDGATRSAEVSTGAPLTERRAEVEAPELEETAEAREAREAEHQKELERADDRLKRDMALLGEAKRALSSDPRAALELARRGEREFPGSALSEERRHVLILSLVAVGRTDEARRLARPYIENHPDSPFARRIQAALDRAGSR